MNFANFGEKNDIFKRFYVVKLTNFKIHAPHAPQTEFKVEGIFDCEKSSSFRRTLET